MPAAQENAEQLLEAIDNYDISELYEAAFEERFRAFISDSKLIELRKKYDAIFEHISDSEDMETDICR